MPVLAPAPAPVNPSPRPPCRHCGRSHVNRPRGLCWPCYYTPGVRELYPSASKFAVRNFGDVFLDAPPPPAPTDALPGSEQKVQVFIERAARCEQLHHPADAGPGHVPDAERPFSERHVVPEPTQRLTVREVCALLGYSRTTFYRKVRAGELRLDDFLERAARLATTAHR